MTNPKENQHLHRAVASFQQRDFTAALSASEALLAIAPAHPEGWHMKALSLGKLQRFDEAERAFEKAAALHPQPHAVWANLGNALRAAARYEDAVGAYSKAIKAKSDFATGWLGLGLASKDAGKDKEAESAYRQALALEPNNASVLNNLGVLLNEPETREEAIRLFNIAVSNQPTLVSAFINRGAALRSAGEMDAAVSDHKRAAEMAPKHPDARHQYANTLRQACAFPEAERQYQAALQLAPQRVDIHRDHEKMLWEIDPKGAFLKTLEQYIAAQPSVALLEAHSDLALLGDKIDAARQSAEQILSRERNNPSALSVLGRILSAQGDHDKAVETLKGALAAASDNFEVMQSLGEALLVAGRFPEAAELLSAPAPREHRQRQVALYVLALRAAGDPLYRHYYDYDRFTAQIQIKTPPGYRDLEEFNAALAKAIAPLHKTSAQPIDQTLYGGTQSFGRLWHEKAPEIQALREALLDAAARFSNALPDDPDHPFLREKATEFQCTGAWSVMLRSGGGHVDHIHPEGWISAAYYVQVPDEVGADASRHAGCLRLGASGVNGLDLGPEKWLKPEAGTAIFFPSYMWHGVEPFESVSARITAPFDLRPKVTSH